MNTLATSRATLLTILIGALIAAEGCRAVEGIFKAGVWVGIVLAVVVVAIIFAVVRMIAN
jgi:hypothetical protein